MRWLACLLLTCSSFGGVAETRVLIVAGLGGNDKFQEEFQRDVNVLATHLKAVANDIVVLANGEREAVAQALQALKKRTDKTDNLVFAFVGHGSYDAHSFRFNIPGPDITGAELVQWLDAVSAKHQLVIVTGSSSGALLPILERENRTTITATRSGEQRNSTVFARYFTAALESDAADLNKDKRISAVEAFDYAKAKVEAFYEEKNQMATEHPQSQGPQPVLVLAQLEEHTTDPRVAHLIGERESLELDIEQLKARKAQMESAAYLAELQRLLLKLAVIESQIDEVDGG